MAIERVLSRNWIKGVAIAAFLSVAMIGAGSPATAHAVYEGWAVVYESDGKCLKDKSTIDHPTEALMTVLAETSAKKDNHGPGYVIHCSDSWVQSPEDLRIKWALFKQTAQGDKVCDSLGYWYDNGQSDYNLSSRGNYNAADPPCGAGYYFLKTRGQVRHNGTWRPAKRGLKSGLHRFPCTEVNEDCAPGLPSRSGSTFFTDNEPATYGALNHLGQQVATINNPLTNDVTWHPPGLDMATVIYLEGAAISPDTDLFLNTHPCPTVPGQPPCNE
jgi:hypothetical protein